MTKKIRLIIVISLPFLMFIYCNRFKDHESTKGKNSVSVRDTVIQDVDFVYVASGVFLRGLDCRPETIPYNYWIGRYEVTNRQFYRFLVVAMAEGSIKLNDSILTYQYDGDSIVSNDSYHVKVLDDRIYIENDSLKLNEEFGDHPVISVTWYGAQAFCSHFGFQLPNEGEWEKAARGANCLRYPWGNQIDSSYANYYNSGDPYEPNTTPVGFYDGSNHSGFQTNDANSIYGCYDMSGNAWEWTSDFWSKEIPFHRGKGGGFHYHTMAHLQIYYVSLFGPGTQPPLDMCDRPDGFRVILKP